VLEIARETAISSTSSPSPSPLCLEPAGRDHRRLTTMATSHSSSATRAGADRKLLRPRRKAIQSAFCTLMPYPEHERKRRRGEAAVAEIASSLSRDHARMARVRTHQTTFSRVIHPIANSYMTSLERELRGKDHAPCTYAVECGVATMQAASGSITWSSRPVSGVLAQYPRQGIGTQHHRPDIGGTTQVLARRARSARVRPSIIVWSRTNPGYPIKTPVMTSSRWHGRSEAIGLVMTWAGLHVGLRARCKSGRPSTGGRRRLRDCIAT